MVMTLANLSILIADDNEMNRWLLSEQMQYWTNDITLACDGLEAWDLLQKHHYSLIFIDVNMPRMSGHDLVKKARAGGLNRSVPMLAITANVRPQQRSQLLVDGFDDCLIKPIVLADLQQAISQWHAPINGTKCNYYADAILEKVANNRQLGHVFLQKLLKDTPAQIIGLEQTLQSRRCHQALEIAHKLNGTFCFYGFEDFREIADSLEKYLLDADIGGAVRQFKQLARKFAELQKMQSSVASRLDTAEI
ncbi:MAG: Hpt domain-containing response regulator [Gammaproteobacteria bacterium]